MEIYIIVALIIGIMFLFREYVHVLEQVSFYREKAVEYNGILRLSIPKWDVDVDETGPFISQSSEAVPDSNDEEEEW